MKHLNQKMLYVVCAAVCLIINSGIEAKAQETVRGKVYDTDKSTPLPGALVSALNGVVHSTSGTDGTFEIKVPEGEQVTVQFMGYAPQAFKVGKTRWYDIVLQPDNERLDEVVVTALGMKREKRSLGYATTELSSDQINEVSSGNWLNGLQGKVAGIQFNNASSGPIGSMKAVVRGETSLSGNSSALFVIDGIPMTSGTVSNVSGKTYTNDDGPIDFGDGAADLNPDDIESVTVLKGAAATALYGSRAGNGAIIITTKSGSKTKGVGVTYNADFSFDFPGYWPEFQTVYGSGLDMGKEPYNFWRASLNPQGHEINYSRYAFGEAYDPSKLRYQYEGYNWDTGEIVATPWVYKDDWYTGIFRTGFTMQNTFTIEGGNGKGTMVRASVKDTRNNWILPNTGYKKQSVSLSLTSPVSKFATLRAKINYYRTDSDNMPSSAYARNSTMYQLVWNRTNVSIKEYAKEYFDGHYNAETFEDYAYLISHTEYYNPYRVLYEFTNSMDKDRVLGNIGVSFNLWKEKLTLDLRTGVDLDTQFRTQRKPKYNYTYPEGFYREQTTMQMEMNSDFMLKYSDSFLHDRLVITAGFGGNNMVYNMKSSKYTLDKLDVEGVYTIDNYPNGTLPDYEVMRLNKVVNSFYGMFSIGWDDWVYLDITGRNDWSSTLSKGNWSFFYPSISGSLVLDKLCNFQQNAPWLTFLKLRASWANVGKDTTPYAIAYNYVSTSYPGGYRTGSTFPDPNLKPENVETWEVGMEAKFLENRIGLDVALYTSNVTNQIYNLPGDYITGAKNYTYNIGLIRNRGIEIALNLVPVKTRNFRWDININASRNRGVLMRMYDGWDNDVPHIEDYSSISNRFFVYDYVGKQMGQIWAIGLKKTPEGSYYYDGNGNKIDCSGQTVIDIRTGLPYNSQDLRCLGNVNPDWTGGFSTRLRYKNLTLGATFAAQLGGKVFSVTASILGYQGKLTNTLEGRYDGLVAEGVNILGQDENGNTVCSVNRTVTSNVYSYYQTYKASRYNFEEYTYDGSYMKLKELRLEYKFPEKIIKKTKVLQGLGIAAYATNLFCVTEYPFYDPDTGVLSGGDIRRGMETGSFPMSRTMGFNVKVQF